MQNKIIIFITLLFSFVFCISAQVKDSSNEVPIDKFLKKENFDRFQFLVSTRENIKALLGEDCEDGRCNYNEDWKMRFAYAGKVAEIRWFQPNEPRNRIFTTYTKPEFVGKLVGIFFNPRKKNVLRDDFIFPSEFKCLENGGREFNCWGDGVFVKYNYKKRDDGTIYEKEIVYIRVGVTIAESDAMKGETEVKDVKEEQTKTGSFPFDIPY
jgi:hypothetical protein